MSEENYTVTITINPNDFLIPLQQTLVECSNAVYFGLSTIDTLIELPESIHAEDEFSYHSPYGGELTLDVRKEIYRNWLIRKGFEDLIKAITNLLIEIIRFYDIHSELKNTKSWEAYQQLMIKPFHKLTKKHYPELMKIVKLHLNDNLLLEEEIDSINKVRNCLAHRNGFVTPEDFNSEDNYLMLKWEYLGLKYIENGIEKDFHKYILLTSEGETKVIKEKKTKKFELNERVQISYQLFNELIFTCDTFGRDLISKLIV